MTPCCANSPFASSTALNGVHYPSTADLSSRAALTTALRTRVFKNELILFSFDFCGLSEALSVILALRAASFEHFAPLTDGPETCHALRRAASARGVDATWPCYYSSWPRDHPGWEAWGTSPGCVSAARASHYCVIEQLWATRYHVAAQILASGVNLLHIDTDVAILADPYALLKQPPFASQNLVILPETPANGGMWYAQNTSDGAGAQWVIGEVARRTLAVIALKMANNRKAQPPFDQAFYGDVLWTAADGGRSHWAAACEHARLRVSALCPENVTHGARSMAWATKRRMAPPNLAAAGSLLPLLPPLKAREARGRHANRARIRRRAIETPCIAEAGGCRKALVKFAELRVPGQSRVESAVTAPPWLFPSAWRAQQSGHFARSPPALSLVHLLGVRCRWCLSSEDVDHGAKWEWQHLAGFWPSRAYTLATPLNTSAAAIATTLSAQQALSESDDDSGGADKALLAPLAERVERNCRKKGRARLLYADRPQLLLARDSEAWRRAESADDGGLLARALVRRLLLIASVIGRVAVLPSFNCSAPWIEKRRSVDGLLVVTDLRVVVVNVAQARPLHEQRCAPCNVQFACREHVLSEAQHAAAVEVYGHKVPRRLALPLRQVGGAGHVIDLAHLWPRLSWRDPSTGLSLDQAHTLELDDVADFEPIDNDSLDRALLRDARPLAARIVMLFCGVADPTRALRQACPRRRATQVAEELTKWERTANEHRGIRGRGRESVYSLLLHRLSVRCGDMLCSAHSCDTYAIEQCVDRMANSSGIWTVDELRDKCTAWLRHLPPHLAPVCNAVTGECASPPVAHAGKVLWPTAVCLRGYNRAWCDHLPLSMPPKRPRDASGMDASTTASGGAARCGSCIVPPRRASPRARWAKRLAGRN